MRHLPSIYSTISAHNTHLQVDTCKKVEFDPKDSIGVKMHLMTRDTTVQHYISIEKGMLSLVRNQFTARANASTQPYT